MENINKTEGAEKIICKLCCGEGYIYRKLNPKSLTKEQKDECVRLYREGFKYREICAKLNIKHPGSVYHAVITANRGRLED